MGLSKLSKAGLSVEGFQWEVAYIGYTVGPESRELMRQLMANQEEIHKRMTYEDEMRLLRKYFEFGIDIRKDIL